MTKQRKIIVIAVFLMIVLTIGVLVACDKTDKVDNTDKNQYYYEDFKFEAIKGGYKVSAYIGNRTEVSVPSAYNDKAVTVIGEDAFFDCTWVRKVVLPDTITKIEKNAFNNCVKLKKIVLSQKLTLIGENAFNNCIELSSVDIPAEVTSIANDAFNNCSVLSRIDVSEDNATYSSKDGILYDKEQTEFLLIPQNLQGEIKIPDGITDIGYRLFDNYNGITSVTIGRGVVNIEGYAFDNCSKLATVNWNAVACISVGSRIYPVFNNCTKLSTVNIGNDVTAIPSNVFSGCSELTTVNWNATACVSAGAGASWDNNIFGSCTKLSTVNIGDNVTTIPSYAFSYCSGLVSITIPEGVTSIGNSAFV